MLFEYRQEHVCKLFIAAQLKVLVVEPFALLVVELGTRFGDAVETELFDEFVHRVHLLIACSVPSEECQEVDDSLGQIAALAITGRYGAVFLIVKLEREDREAESVSVTLGEFAVSVGLEQQGQVRELRHRITPTERTVEQHMERGGRQPLFATNDVTDLHQMVIDDIGKVVRRQVIG